MNLLDLITATTTKHQAINQVQQNADPTWMATIHQLIQHIATTTTTFTSDDLWHAIENQQLPIPHEPRALGAAMRQAHRDGLIQPTANYRPSHRVACHARPIRVWTAA